MPTTTNFGWTTPADTDLVKDGAAAIRTLGNGIDTSFLDLKGGTSGQILSKNSNTDLDFVWIANDQGDITAVTAGTGISGGGTSGAVTITNSMATEITASGDIIVGTGSGTFDNLPIGSTGQVLTADTTVSPYKVKWATPASGLTLITRTSYSNVASQTFDNVFSTTYKAYLIIVEKHEAVTVNDSFEFIFRYGTTDATAHGGNCIYATTGGTGTAAGTTNAASLKVNIGSGSSVYPLNAVMYVHNVGTGSSIRPAIYGQGWEMYNTRMFQFAGYSDTVQNMTGFKVKSSNTNITGTIAVYGYGI